MYKKGRVFKRGNVWYIDFSANGRRIREAVGENKKLAETVLAKKITEVNENKFLDVRKNKRITFEDFAKTFIERYSKIHKRSWISDFHNLKSLNKFFKGKFLYEIRPQDIEDFISERIKVVSPSTVNRQLATLSKMLNLAVAWGELDKSPMKNIKFLKEPAGRLRYLEIAEIQRLIASCSEKLRPIVILALNCGMRRGEILSLKWPDINFQREVIRLTDTKNGEVRAVPMNSTVKQVLMRIPRNPNSPYVFCDKDGKPYHDVRKSFFTALKKAGIMDCLFHTLRHTYASQLLMVGVDINTTRELLGHKDLRMTLRYAHLSPDFKKRAVEVLDSKIGIKSDTNVAQKPISENEEKLTVSQLLENTEVI